MIVGRPIENITSDGAPSAWQFWIDVGGTFTDCFGRSPHGELFRHKLLSSGATKGLAQAGSTGRQIVDSLRCGDPPDFWSGYQLQLVRQGRASHPLMPRVERL